MPLQTAICTPSLKISFNHHSWERVLTLTNCYAYALQCPQMGWAQPGQLMAPRIVRMTQPEILLENLKPRILRDGLLEITREQAMSGNFHAIALRLCPGRDYHFLVRNWDGFWTHKLGDAPPHAMDSEGQSIRNPEMGELYHYGQFGGYYAIPDEGISYVPRC